MSTIRITKEFKFEMAHALKGYDGPCKHIHGHSYELFVTVIGKPVNDNSSSKNGMVMDFNLLKNIVRENIIRHYDHALVLQQESAALIREDSNGLIREDSNGLIREDSNDLFSNMLVVDYQPTSENMLIHFAGILKDKLPADVKLYSLLLRETVTSFAEWFASDNE